jgi:hypothetical protein
MSPFHPSRVLEAGSRIQLHCVVEKGDAPLVISWTKDSRPIVDEFDVAGLGDGGGHQSASIRVVGLGGYSSILTVDSVGAGHSGNYSCRAENSAGESVITTTLIVRGTLYIHIMMRHVRAAGLSYWHILHAAREPSREEFFLHIWQHCACPLI